MVVRGGCGSLLREDALLGFPIVFSTELFEQLGKLVVLQVQFLL